MTDTGIRGRRIAFLATDGVDAAQLQAVWDRFDAEGMLPVLVGIHGGDLQSVGAPLAEPFSADLLVDDLGAMDVDAVIVCDGAFSVAGLACEPEVLRALRDLARAGTPVATIGRRVIASAPTAPALADAGARVVDADVLVDDHLVTARGTDAIPVLVTRVLERLREGVPAFTSFSS